MYRNECKYKIQNCDKKITPSTFHYCRKTSTSQGQQEGILSLLPGTKETATDCLHAEARTGEERQNLRGARRRGGGRSGTDALQERSYEGIAEVTAAIKIRNRTTNIFG